MEADAVRNCTGLSTDTSVVRIGTKTVPYDPAKVLGPVHMERLQNAA